MKTNISIQKTENREFGKSTILTFALVISFVSLSLAVSAKGFQKHSQPTNSFSPTALVMEPLQLQQMMNYHFSPLAHSSELINASTILMVEASAEKNLEIESWMTNEHNFLAPATFLEVEVEKPLGVEGWMLSGQNFLESTLTIDQEKTIEVESWMLDQSNWTINENL